MKNIKVYNIPLDEVLLYRNMVGCFSINDDATKIKTQVNKFKELSPFNKNQKLSTTLKYIDFHARYFIEKINTEFDDSIEGRAERKKYKHSYLVILGNLLNLNLSKTNDYKEIYERTNTILSFALSSLNNMDNKDVIALYEAIKKEDKKSIEKFQNQKPTLTLLLLLSMIDEDLPDYKIFTDDNEIDLDSLFCMVKENNGKSIKMINNKYILRPSYKDIESIQKEV